VSFEAGMYQWALGREPTTGDSQLVRAEPIEDIARLISRMVDKVVMIRTYSSQDRVLPPRTRACRK